MDVRFTSLPTPSLDTTNSHIPTTLGSSWDFGADSSLCPNPGGKRG